MTPSYTLISHRLCPYVQRAAIVLSEKSIAFTRRDVDLRHKPDWFLHLSPLGKTPVLVVDQQPIFESAVICEYLDETHTPKLHPQDALTRAQHRGWIEFGSSILDAIGGFYSALDDAALLAKLAVLERRFEHLERALGDGPYFAGASFSVVDAVYGPIFRYFDVFDGIDDFGFFKHTPRVRAWRQALAQRDSVQRAVGADYQELLRAFLLERGGALSLRMSAQPIQ